MQHPEYLYHYTSVLNLPYILPGISVFKINTEQSCKAKTILERTTS